MPTADSKRYVAGQGAPVSRALALASVHAPELLWLGVPMLVLLWAIWEHGSFLEPARTVAAVVPAALGLAGLLLRRRLLASDEASHAQPWGYVEIALSGLAILGIVSAGWSLDRRASIEAAGILVGGVFFLRFGRAAAGSPRSRRSLLIVLSEVGVLMAVLSMSGLLLHISWLTQDLEGLVLPTGTFGYANALAGFLVLTLASTVALFLDSLPSRSEGERQASREHDGEPQVALPRDSTYVWLFAAASILQVVALVLTRSRAIAVIAVVLIVIVLCTRLAGVLGSAKARWGAVSVSLAALALIISVLVVFRTDLAAHISSADSFRLKTWAAGLEAVRQRPILGHGLGTFYQAYAPFKEGAQTSYAHNIFVQYTVELGLIGTALIAGFLSLTIARPLRTVFRRLTDPRVALVLGLLGFTIQNLVDLTWYFPALFFTFTLLLGVALPAGRTGEHGGELHGSPTM